MTWTTAGIFLLKLTGIFDDGRKREKYSDAYRAKRREESESSLAFQAIANYYNFVVQKRLLKENTAHRDLDYDAKDPHLPARDEIRQDIVERWPKFLHRPVLFVSNVVPSKESVEKEPKFNIVLRNITERFGAVFDAVAESARRISIIQFLKQPIVAPAAVLLAGLVIVGSSPGKAPAEKQAYAPPPPKPMPVVQKIVQKKTAQKIQPLNVQDCKAGNVRNILRENFLRANHLPQNATAIEIKKAKRKSGAWKFALDEIGKRRAVHSHSAADRIIQRIEGNKDFLKSAGCPNYKFRI